MIATHMYNLSKNIGSDKQGEPSLVRLLENDSHFYNVAACLSGKCDCKRVGINQHLRTLESSHQHSTARSS